MNALQNKVALVTGSSRGIGAAIARRFAAEGARVAVHGRDRKMVDAVRAEIEAARGRAIGVTGEVTRFSDIEAMRTTIEKELGPVDVLVTNAGASYTKPGLAVEEHSEEEWRRAVDGNLTATFLTIKSFLPGMKQRRAGVVLTMSSAAARRPHPGSPIPYAVAKAGIQLLTQDLAVQAGPHGIRACCLAPETIITERTDQQIPEAVKASLIETHPIRRLGTPEDVAQAALFLASDAAGWISGIILDIAGGSVLA
jgi:3-oxoacyl-[acyl-carrier protein] reductase